jgi:predicted HicB family RNase H-like nuclease
MEYKGYIGKAEYDDDAEIFYGEVLGTLDVITFKGDSVEELKKSFRESIDEYLAFCARLGREPQASGSGKLILRVRPGLHAKVSMLAKREGQSINSWITRALEEEVGKRSSLR